MLTLTVAAALAAPPRDINVWEVTKNGHTSHVMGTCHIPIPLASALPAPHDRFVRDARVVVDEIEPDMDPMQVLRLLADPSVTPLSERLSPEVYAALVTRLQALPAPMIEHTPDWMLMLFLSFPLPDPPSPTSSATAAGGRGAGAPPPPPPPVLDVAIAQLAARTSRPKRHLETLDEQLAMMQGIQVDLAALLQPNAQRAASEHALMDACWTGQLDAAAGVIDKLADDPGLRMAERNAAWWPKLDAELEQGDAFVAVGLGHLIGPRGLLATLASDGYRVERLRTRQAAAQPPAKAAAASPAAPTAAAPYDAAKVDAVVAGPMATQVQAACADASSPIRRCLAPDEAACRARVVHDLRLCAVQKHGSLEEATTDGGLFLCALTGLTLDGMVNGTTSDDPVCAALAPKPTP